MKDFEVTVVVKVNIVAEDADTAEHTAVMLLESVDCTTFDEIVCVEEITE